MKNNFKSGKMPLWIVFAWNTRSISVAVSGVLMMQLTFYSTEVLGLPIGAIGALFLAAKIFDGVTDLVAGFLIDKTNTKWGKARPYELFVIPLWLLIIAVYSTPDMGTNGKMIFIFIMYTLINSVCSTFLAASETVYMGRSIDGDQNRAKVMAAGGVFVMLFAAISSMVLPQLMSTIGTQTGGWTKIAFYYAIPMLVIGMIRFIFIKEHSVDSNSASVDKLGFKESIQALIKNKYIFIFMGLILLSNLVYNITNLVGTYFFQYVYGNLGAMSIIGLLGLLSAFAFLLFPVIQKKFGSVRFVGVGLILAIICAITRFFFPHNLAVIAATVLLSSIGLTSFTMMNHFFIIQCIDYGELITGKRVEGVPASISGFGSKLGSGLASVLTGGIMAISGFVSGAAVQTEGALMSIRILYSIIPAILAVLMLIILKFFDVEKKLEKMRENEI